MRAVAVVVVRFGNIGTKSEVRDPGSMWLMTFKFLGLRCATPQARYSPPPAGVVESEGNGGVHFPQQGEKRARPARNTCSDECMSLRTLSRAEHNRVLPRLRSRPAKTNHPLFFRPSSCFKRRQKDAWQKDPASNTFLMPSHRSALFFLSVRRGTEARIIWSPMCRIFTTP